MSEHINFPQPSHTMCLRGASRHQASHRLKYTGEGHHICGRSLPFLIPPPSSGGRIVHVGLSCSALYMTVPPSRRILRNLPAISSAPNTFLLHPSPTSCKHVLPTSPICTLVCIPWSCNYLDSSPGPYFGTFPPSPTVYPGPTRGPAPLSTPAMAR